MTYGGADKPMKVPSIFSIPEARSTKRNYGLDMLRSVAILLVLFCHGLVVLPQMMDTLVFYWTGFFGVELFFVLSGYLIGSILLSLMEASTAAVPFRSRLFGFWIRRWFRTLPNYYFFLAINVVLALAACAAAGRPIALEPDSYKYLYFGQNLFRPIGEFMSESWSLAVEEWFYITFPLLLVLVASLRMRPRLAFGLAACFYIVLFATLRTLVSLGGGVDWDVHLRKIVSIRLDSIAYGALMMLIMRAKPQAMRKYRHVLLGVGLIAIALSAVVMDRYLHRPIWVANLFTLTSLGAACLLPFCVFATETAPRSGTRSVIAGISIVSYSLYLAHLPVLRLTTYFLKTATWQEQYGLYLLFTFAVSIVVYTLYERRMTHARERFGKKSDVEL